MSLQVSSFESLVGAIADAHAQLQTQATKAVNMALTLRNWLIGGYIAVFELQGADRAQYGEKLLTELARELLRHQVSTTGRRQLYNYSTVVFWPTIDDSSSRHDRLLLGK